MHLGSWDILKRPISEGGLQIRDPGLANPTMGGRLIWELYTNKNHPVSMIFWMKYLKVGSLRNITTSNTFSWTTIWNLCRKGLTISTNNSTESLAMGRGFFCGMINFLEIPLFPLLPH